MLPSISKAGPRRVTYYLQHVRAATDQHLENGEASILFNELLKVDLLRSDIDQLIHDEGVS